MSQHQINTLTARAESGLDRAIRNQQSARRRVQTRRAMRHGQ